MTEITEALGSSPRNLVIIGTLALTDPDYWEQFRSSIAPRIQAGDLHCRVVAESDNELFQHSLRTDTSYASGGSRLTFTELRFRSNLIEKELLRVGGPTTFQRSTLPLPLHVLKIDDEVWYLPITGYRVAVERFRRLGAGDTWSEMIQDYINRLLDNKRDGRYVTPPNTELLELFDQDQIPRGIYPRDCFYGTDHYQWVIWAFVFSRKGELLIHKRGANAKDNQSMWDKSVGGHIDFRLERASSASVVRELIEELYTKEKKQQSGHAFSLLSEDPSRVHYLGHWRPGDIGPDYLQPVARLEEGTAKGEEPWVYFKIPGTIQRDTPRILPDGTQRKLRVLADAYIFLSNTLLTREYAKGELKNSEYELLEPSKIKSWIDLGKDDREQEFLATPDLQFIMSGRLRNTIEEASQMVRYARVRR